MRDQGIYRTIGRRLRARRRLLELTQRDVGTRCGLTFQQIQKYEAGLIAMPIARLIALAEALQTPIEDFIHSLPTAPPAPVPSDPERGSWPLGEQGGRVTAEATR
ncbi:helix-turn-helix transcriptional regulator [Phenylobacterium sp.]|uniref:helix-turn-helix domain-containing protein n=1 Tax=Phenylobacterium sp. TaxID=1871053 RepID=UPI002E2F5A69|nr:helix-turn-helix transcriptional regulator [Phenylobacterium sp.]HEX4711877.1 helix-turn-helix transcriptional regulator [Phenylobacterium sp.]